MMSSQREGIKTESVNKSRLSDKKDKYWTKGHCK